MSSDGLVLLYDGGCGFCDWGVRFVLKRDRGGAMRFAALESDAGREIVGRHRGLEGIDSVVLVERVGGEERVRVRSGAVVGVLRYLGGLWGVLGMVLRVVPRGLRDWGYGVVARHRRRLPVRACGVLTEEERGRFLG